ncbi:MAG: PPC domain-containing DNA-binding protein [Bacteroidota bacterium]
MNNEISKHEYASSQSTTTFALRLKPDQDLRNELEIFTKEHNIQAGYIITSVGSLKSASLRLADQSNPKNYSEKFEIVSLVGTLSTDGVHLHISIADKDGKTIGGHLVEGCKIYTTAEIIIGNAEGMLFLREQDEQTGFKELKIKQK